MLASSSSRIASSSAMSPPLAGSRQTAASAAVPAALSKTSPILMASKFLRQPTASFASSSPKLPLRPSQRTVTAAAAPGEVSTATKPLELHVGPTTLSLPFNQQRAAELKAALALLLATFAEKAKAERPKRWQSLEYKFRGGDGEESSGSTPPGIALFEVFCNPNAAASPFDAKVLVTVKSTDGGVGFTTEAPLSALRADLEAY